MVELIKKVVPEGSFLFSFLRNTKRNFEGIPHHKSISGILQTYAELKKGVFFIQIGSNDGTTGDPISEYIKGYNWTGVLVEPVPYIFDRLKENYSAYSERLKFENAAIAKQNGEAKFYRLKECNDSLMPEWYDQLGSFNKEVVLKHRPHIARFDELFTEDTVKIMTFNSLLEKHHINNVHVIHIDTEGYDFEVIKLIDFSKWGPDLLLFEHKHLSDGEYKEALKLLRSFGFKLYEDHGDTIAINRKINSLKWLT